MKTRVTKGQVWESRDPRDNGRTVFITGKLKAGDLWRADSSTGRRVTISARTLNKRFRLVR